MNRHRSVRSIVTLALASCVVTLLASCASSVRYVDVDSKPSGATIYVNGEKKGVTRTQKLKLDFGKNPQGRLLIQLSKPRYKPVFQYWTLDEVPEKKVFPLEVD